MSRSRPARAPRRRRAAVPATVAVLLAALCTGTAPAGHGSAPAKDFDATTVERVDGALGKLLKETGLPGVTVGLWIPGRGSYVKSLGVADTKTGTPMKTDLYSRVGSITKTFTVTGVLQLVDQGKVGLDDPISRYVTGVPNGEHITVRQLAELRSGLFDYIDDKQWQTDLRDDPERAYNPRRLLDIAFAHPPTFKPGAKWQYSNTNLILLGMLVEKVSGRHLSDYLQEHVFAPLKLKSTSLPTGAAIPDPHAHGYTDFTPDGAITDATAWNPSWAWATGAAVSDMNDLRAWTPALLDGKLLTKKTQAERLKTLPTGVPGISYGLGVLDTAGWIGHNGDLPGYEAVAVRHPDDKAVLVILLNSNVNHQDKNLSSLVAHTVTSIVTPDHPWPAPTPVNPE
ncbi:serine hydrolase domain-containing protein [Streptomyces sp. CA-243310]|uniref:serine hydrolase domain-containing protein n=1 Tax=Streptomyces sp. CA-243310 TaxID=3240056 RepID=UPI003D8E52C3